MNDISEKNHFWREVYRLEIFLVVVLSNEYTSSTLILGSSKNIEVFISLALKKAGNPRKYVCTDFSLFSSKIIVYLDCITRNFRSI